MEQEILDYSPKDGPEYKNNRLFSSVRYGLSAFIMINLFKTIFRQFQAGNYQDLSTVDQYAGMLIPIILYGYFVFYNLKQGKMEARDENIFPAFGMTLLLLFIVVILWIIIVSYSSVLQGGTNGIFIVICCIIILLREFKYFGHLAKA